MTLATHAWRVDCDFVIEPGHSDSYALSIGDFSGLTGVLTGGGFAISRAESGGSPNWRVDFNGPSGSSSSTATPVAPVTWIVGITNTGDVDVQIEQVYIVVATDS